MNESENLKNVTCRPQNEIDEFFASKFLYISVFAQDLILSATNFEKYAEYKIRNFFYLLDYKKSKISNHFAKIIDFNYDTGLIWTEENSKQFYSIDQIENDQGSLINGNLFSFAIYQSEKKDIYQLIYLKLSDVIAKVGGFANVILVVF
jgi:hypothetical protein